MITLTWGAARGREEDRHVITRFTVRMAAEGNRLLESVDILKAKSYLDTSDLLLAS